MKKTVNETNFFLFLKQLIYNDSLEENFLSVTPWRFIDPLVELAVTLFTLEVETAWVLLGARVGQYQGLVAVTRNVPVQCCGSTGEFEFIHVQYCQLDSSGENIESDGIQS